MNPLPPYEEWDQAERDEFDKVALQCFALTPEKQIQAIKDLRVVWSNTHNGDWPGLKDCKDAVDRAKNGYSVLAKLVFDKDELNMLIESVSFKVALGADPALLKKLEEAKERQGWT
jgi:hypothetical protein